MHRSRFRASGCRVPVRLVGQVMWLFALMIPSLCAELAPHQFAVRGTPARDQVLPAPFIKVDVNLVLVPVTIADPRGKVMEGLEPERFVVLENGHKQDIVSFSSENAPVSVGLVYDTSGSMGEKIRTSRWATKSFLDALEPADEAMLVTFADRPILSKDFTGDFSTIHTNLLREIPDGRTALVDAVYFALARMGSAWNARKALVVVTDGLENHSRYSERELMRFALEADTQIFTIGVHGRTPAEDAANYVEVQSAISLLDELSTRTGGIHFMIEDFTQLKDALERIARALHSRYVLGYYPTSPTLDGKWRRITVKVHRPKGFPPLSVHARAGYYGPERR